MRRWTLPSRAERGRVILSGAWTTSTCYKPREIERQGHNAIAEHLVHRAFKAVHCLYHEVNGWVAELLGSSGVEAPDQLGRVFQVGKQDRHLLAFTFQSGAGRDNFLGEVRRGVSERRLRGCLCGRGGGWRRGPRLTRPDQHGPFFIH